MRFRNPYREMEKTVVLFQDSIVFHECLSSAKKLFFEKSLQLKEIILPLYSGIEIGIFDYDERL